MMKLYSNRAFHATSVYFKKESIAGFHFTRSISVKWVGGHSEIFDSPQYDTVFNWQNLLEESFLDVQNMKGSGKVASYIPALAEVDPKNFGVAMATIDGSVFKLGDADIPFSMQSVSKVFSLILAMRHAHNDLWKYVGREPSGDPFNSLIQLEYEQGKPRNPFINSGAIVTTDILEKYTSTSLCSTKLKHHFRGSSEEILHFLRTESGNPFIHVDENVAASEKQTGHRNYALAHFMKSCNNLHNPVDVVLDHYFRQCSIALSCVDLAKAGLILARHGRDVNGVQVLDPYEAKRVQAIMMTCGTYDAAGELAYRVGIPCKSGVGGAILSIFPRVGAVAVWSPGLDEKGNSVAGVGFLEALTTKSNFSVF